ncbi:helix-turn-helix transcriptional regulator [Paracoccaceae bacterium]|nr:helix-turn-helix transcriptional regulator [Paracoccaceae bacterium]
MPHGKIVKAWVNLALRELNCKQKELAQKVGVSTGQVSKWKNHGEHMSIDIEDKFKFLCPIGDLQPDFVLSLGNVEDAIKWSECLSFLAEQSANNAEEEWDYDCGLLRDFDKTHMILNLTTTLDELGFVWPKEMNVPHNFEDTEFDFDDFFQNSQIASIREIFRSFGEIRFFYESYFQNSFDSLFELGEISIEEISIFEDNLLKLAACKVNIETAIAPNHRNFQFKYVFWFKDKIAVLKKKAFQANVPLQEELSKLITNDSDNLALLAQEISLQDQLHPDIYFNELLTGMREIRKVLPAIMEKLDIKTTDQGPMPEERDLSNIFKNLR